ncbi:MAG: phosphate ABC transporter permease PstA [Candidatus Aminicenantia bacterium]
MKEQIQRRILKDRLFKIIVISLSFLSTLPLFFILFHLIKTGITSLSFEFLFNLPKPVGEEGGGILNAIVGTFILILLSSSISIPIGVSLGIYLSDNRDKRIAKMVTLIVDILQGVPSIVLGIIAYLWIVKPMGHFSAFSGGIALALMMLPIIIKSTEETLNLIPESLKEASLALGAPYYKTVLKVVLPTGLNGIFIGILLGISRIAGETAPLLFTAFGNPFMNLNIFKPIESLPHLIFTYAKSPFPDWHAKAWAASFVLILIVFTLNILSKWVVKRWKVRF